MLTDQMEFYEVTMKYLKEMAAPYVDTYLVTQEATAPKDSTIAEISIR